jgi:hypothetical protein
MTTEQIILEAFRRDIDSEGLFWRIYRPNTFVDLLTLDAYKASSQGVNTSLAIRIIITLLKAIVNDRYGMLDYKLDFEEINKQVSQEKDKILSDIKEILTEYLNSNNQFEKNLFDDLNYIKVLNNLKIDNFTVQVFENILESFLAYINTKK